MLVRVIKLMSILLYCYMYGLKKDIYTIPHVFLRPCMYEYARELYIIIISEKNMQYVCV